MPEQRVDPEELRAAVEARRELGSELEPHVIDSFVERIERRLDERAHAKPALRSDHSEHTLALAIVSLGAAIPLSAIGAVQAGLVGLLVVWIGIVLVLVVYGSRR